MLVQLTKIVSEICGLNVINTYHFLHLQRVKQMDQIPMMIKRQNFAIIDNLADDMLCVKLVEDISCSINFFICGQQIESIVDINCSKKKLYLQIESNGDMWLKECIRQNLCN